MAVQYTIDGASEPGRGPAVLENMNEMVEMDLHTLELLEFGKVRELLSGYAASSLGKELARQLEPSLDADAIRAELTLTTEMVDAWIRIRRRRSAVCTMFA